MSLMEALGTAFVAVRSMFAVFVQSVMHCWISCLVAKIVTSLSPLFRVSKYEKFIVSWSGISSIAEFIGESG